jgi:hypothetical protein
MGAVDRMELIMSEKRWKRHEREIAGDFGTERVLQKGRDVPDFETDAVVGEVKSRKSLPRWLKEAMAQARQYAQPLNHKLPVLCLREKGMRGYFVVIHSEDFADWYGDLPMRTMDEGCREALCPRAINRGILVLPESVYGLPCYSKYCPKEKQE